MRNFPQPIRMKYVVNFTSMQYIMSTLVDTGAEGTLSTIVAGGGERVNEELIVVWCAAMKLSVGKPESLLHLITRCNYAAVYVCVIELR